MADYKIGDLANLISSSSPSNETPTKDLFSKKKKKRSADNEPEVVANGREELESPDMKKKKKKKHNQKVVSEEPESNTVSIIPVKSNGTDEGSRKKKKRKHKDDNVEENQSQTTVTVVASNDAQEETPKKKKKNKHKENEKDSETTVTVVTANSSDKPAAEKPKKKRIRKKIKKPKTNEALKTDTVTPTENGTNKPEGSSPSVNKKVKTTKTVTSSQDDEARKNKKKQKKLRKKQLKKLKKAADKAKSTAESANNEQTVTLEKKEDKKDKSKKDMKVERIKERKNQSLPNQHPDAESRTIFIGNVNMETKRKHLMKVFAKYGKVEAVRIRGVAVGEQGMRKKVAHVTGQMHPSRSSVAAYVRFESIDSVNAALETNGMELGGNHLNVDKALNEEKREIKNSVFVGNLPWEAEDEQLYQHFKECGEIHSVRIVRDKELKSGKGFGYVNFKSNDATEVALQLAGKMFMNRPLRVVRCTKKQKKEKVKDDNITKKSNMKLDFMKKKDKLKPKNNQQIQEKASESEFSGAKTAELGKNKKIKKPRWSKEDKKKASVASLLTGDKAVVQRPKFIAKKGGGKPTGKPIAKKFGGKPGGKFGGKPGGKFGGKPGGKYGGKPGGRPFSGKPGGKPNAGKTEPGGTGQNKRITFG